MTKSIRSKLASLLGVALVASALAVAAFPATAAADDVSASATALGGLSGVCTASGSPDGVSYPDQDGGSRCGSEALLPLSPLVTLGALGQDVLVDTDGHSQACAGVVAQGGALQISDPTGCTPSGGNGSGLTVGVPGVIDLRVSAVFAECSASATGLTGSAAVADDLSLAVLGVPLANLGDILNAAPNSTPISLGGLLTLTLNQQVRSPDGSSITVTALRLQLLGLDVNIGVATCSVDDVNGDYTLGAFDGSADVTPPTTSTQPGTRNALTVAFNPGGDRNDAEGIIRFGPGVSIDTNRANNPATRTAPFGAGGPFTVSGQNDGLPSGCTFVNIVNDPRVECDFGDLNGSEVPVVTIPVIIADDAPAIIEASAQFISSTSSPDADIFYGEGPTSNQGRGPTFGGSLLPTYGGPQANQPTNDDRDGLIQIPRLVEAVRTEGNAGSTVSITDIRLPNTIPGQLYLDLPDYVTAANYGSTICNILSEPVSPAQHLQATAYPENPDAGFTRWDCRQAQKPANESRVLTLTIADGTPGTPANAEPPVGRIVIVRRDGVTGNNNNFTQNPIFTPPFVQENSYYSNLFLRVVNTPLPDADPSGILTASVSPTSRPAPGGDFTYTVNVQNNSGNSETLTTLTQSINGGTATSLNNVGTCATGGTIAAGATYTCTFVDALTGVTGATESHTFAASVSDADETVPVAPVTATAVLGNGRTLSVVKAAVDSIPFPGGDVTYTVTITNPNPVAVTINSLKDTVGNGTPVTLDGDADCKVGTVLNPAGSTGDRCSFEFTLPLTGAVGTSQTDVVTVEVTPADGPKFSTPSNSKTVTISEPSPLDVTLKAEPNSLPEPGGKVKFTLNAKNLNPAAANGANDLKITSLKVQYNPTVDAKSMDESTCDVGATLKPGDTYTCTFTDDVQGNVGVVTYKAIGIAQNPAGTSFTDEGSADVTLTNVAPEIDVKLTVDPAARKAPGGDFTWTVTVTNISKASSDPVTITGLKDDLLGSKLAEDANCKKLLGVTLDVGKSASCSFVSKVEGPDGKVATDLVVVNGEDDEETATSDFGVASVSLTAGDTPTPPPPADPKCNTRCSMPVTGANSRTTAAAAMLFAGLGLVLKGGGMQAAPELAVEGKRRRRR